MKLALLAAAASLIALPVVAAPAGVWGAGAQTCANWNEARAGDTAWKDYFEGWAMGYLSDANVRRYSTSDPNPAVGDLLTSHQPALYFKAIDAACAAAPDSLVVTAVMGVIQQLGTAENLRDAVSR